MSDERQLRISSWAIRNPTPVALIFVVGVIAGILSYLALPVKYYPNITFPAVRVTVTRAGAAPAEMESQVTRPIENALASLTNVESINSSVTQGSSTTMIQFELGQDLQKATDDVRSKVDQTRNILPREVDPPIVQRSDFEDNPLITYAVSAPAMSPADLSWFIDDTLSRTLQAQPGVGKIYRVGGVDREINVLVDPDRLAANGLTASQVNDALAQAEVDAPGGAVTIGGREQTVRVLGSVASVDAIRNLSIAAGGGRFVRLGDVADVGDGAAEPRTLALLSDRAGDGKAHPVVGFQITKTRDASEITVENGVDAAIKDIEKANPGVTVHKIASQVDSTRASFTATWHTLLEGMALAALVVWLFLRDWRATAVTAVAMPASLIPVFVFMELIGFSLNLVTLLGLTLVIGILVDDAIVEIENIEKRVFAGMRPYQAAMEGADQIGLAVVATTFAIVAVFFPVGLMAGITGQFFREFGITVSVAVLISLVVARLLTPLLAAYFLKPKPARERKPLPALYTRALAWALDHMWASLAIGTVFFILSMALAIPVKKGVQPEGNPNYMNINIEGPPGATLADMRVVVDRLGGLLMGQPETASVFASVGNGGAYGGPGSFSSSAGVNRGSVVTVLKADRKAKVAAIRDRLRPLLREIPDARLSFDTSGFGAADVQVILGSESGEGLESATLALQREMRGVPGLADPRPVTPLSSAELVVRPRPEEAARLGVSATSIAAAARVATSGEIDANVAKLDQGERRIPIRVRLPLTDRTDLSVIKNLRLPTASGGVTTLDSVADVYFQAGPAQIDRAARKRILTTIADTTGDTQVGDAQARVNALPIMKHLSSGVAKIDQGQEKVYAQMFSSFGLAILSGIFLVYAVMVLLFRSFFKPLIILSALPTAIGGAFFFLLIFDLSLSIPSLIGFLMLMGLAAKNSILLVEYAIARQREGVGRRDALIEACRERARPIVMTSLAMGAGMLPTALALGQGSEFRQPMAVAVIGGLITSTVLSLLLVPVVYEFVDKIENWMAPRFGRLVTPREAPVTAIRRRPIKTAAE